MTKAGRSLTQLGKELTWLGLAAFLRNLHGDSAYLRARYGQTAEWRETPLPPMLADLIDQVHLLRCEYAAAHGVKGNSYKPYPRPGTEHAHREAMPREDFYEWMKEVAADG